MKNHRRPHQNCGRIDLTDPASKGTRLPVDRQSQANSKWVNSKHLQDVGGYCWTHGHCLDIGHDSKTCRSKREVHKENATRSDNIGGNLYDKPRAWGRERVGEIMSNTKMNISHDLQVRNLYPIADSGANLNCLCMNSPSEYYRQIETIRALLPDGNKISTHIQCKINMDGLPEKSKIAYKFNGIQELLMSIPVLCDNRCKFKFTKRTVQVHKEGQTVLIGYREPATKLWSFPQDETTPIAVPWVTQQISAILPEGTMSDTLNFLHRIIESPTNTTLQNAIRKNIFSTWPSFIESNISKFLPNSISTTLGHQDPTRRNSQSTQQTTLKTTYNRYINIYGSINQPEMPT